jgi:adenylate cyclase
MSEQDVRRRLAAILAADVAGYSRLMGEDEAGTRARFNAHFAELVEPAIARRRGRIVKHLGDGLLVEFASIVDAVQSAVDIQKGMAERNADEPADERIDFRMGINIGDVIVEGDDIHGDGVNVAARIESLADPGGICISRSAREQIRDKLDFPLEDMGEVGVKNIARPVHVYRIVTGAPPPPLRARSQARPRSGLPCCSRRSWRSRRWPAGS